MKFYALHNIYAWTALLLFAGCSQTPTPPSISVTQPANTPPMTQSAFGTPDISIPEPCKDIKIVGELTPFEFEKIFDCLNIKGNLNGLKPLVLGSAEGIAFFTKIYNESFSANPTARKETLELIDSLNKNHGLSDHLHVLSLFITEFIDTPDFDQTLKPLINEILTDDLDLLSLLKSVVTYRDFEKLKTLLTDTLRDERLTENLNSFSTFLKYKDSSGQKGSQSLVLFLKNALSLSKSPLTSQSFTKEDAYQLARAEIPRSFLRTLYELKEKNKLNTLIQLLSDLSTRQTTTILTEERLQALSNPNAPLSPQQREASLKVLKAHPVNDLSALIKLISSFHRGFCADDTGENRNFLNSLDKFLQDVKASLDSHPKLGPDSDAARRMTTYRIYVNLAHQELMDPSFHALLDDEKFNRYTEENGENSYSHFIRTYKAVKLSFEYKREERNLRAQEPPLSEDEIDERLKDFKKTFQKELPKLVASYKDFLNQEIKDALYFINHYPLLLGSTPYQLLQAIQKDTQSISLLGMQALLNLKNEALHSLIEDVVEKFKKFHDFNRPVEEFMRSVEEDSIADSTWLHHTVDPILYFMGKEVPLKDRISLMTFIQSYQAIERLFLTENRLWEIKDIVIPFLEKIGSANQENRTLALLQFLHSGNFYLDPEEKNRDEDHEAKELITQFSSLLIPMLESGFFKNTLSLLASFGHPDSQSAETTNQLIKFLLSPHDSSQARAIDPLLETLKRLSQDHPQALEQFLDQLAQFLTPETIQHLKDFFLIYEKTIHSESILTQMIKRDEIRPFLHTIKHMLDQNTFRSTHHFIKELIDKGQLKDSLELLVKLLMVSQPKK